MSARILIVEDDTEIAANIYDFLSARGYQTDAAPNGLTALHLLSETRFDAVILDIGLPGIDGLSLLARVRQDLRLDLPVLLLTARDTLDDKLEGFNAGADDYLNKPFALKELHVRIEALIKRAQGRVVSPVQHLGALSLDNLSGEVHWQGLPLRLPPKSLKLLEILMRQPGRLWSREELELSVWGEEQETSDTLRHHLSQLRRALTLQDGRCPLQTVHGRGYRLVDPEKTDAP
jgi:DNA-binding response OmpR family regulator